MGRDVKSIQNVIKIETDRFEYLKIRRLCESKSPQIESWSINWEVLEAIVKYYYIKHVEGNKLRLK